jgi:hypothetical protein
MADLLQNNTEEKGDEPEFDFEELRDLEQLKQLVQEKEKSAQNNGIWGSI